MLYLIETEVNSKIEDIEWSRQFKDPKIVLIPGQPSVPIVHGPKSCKALIGVAAKL